MYDFPLQEISEPVKTIAWLLQNKPERFRLTEIGGTSQNPHNETQVLDQKTCKTFVVRRGDLYNSIAMVMQQDWMTPVEKMYLAQEVIALVSRNRQKVLQKEKDKWLQAYQEDISGEESVSEPEAKPEPENLLKHELSPLEKVAKEHTAKLLAEKVRKEDLKSVGYVILAGIVTLAIPMLYLVLSK